MKTYAKQYIQISIENHSTRTNQNVQYLKCTLWRIKFHTVCKFSIIFLVKIQIHAHIDYIGLVRNLSLCSNIIQFRGLCWISELFEKRKIKTSCVLMGNECFHSRHEISVCLEQWLSRRTQLQLFKHWKWYSANIYYQQ